MKFASKVPGVRTTKIGYARRIVRASFFEAIDIPDPLPPETRPLLMTPKDAERYGLSRTTVDRMIAQGRADRAAEAETSQENTAA
jgi:hypothetical protein